MSSQVLESLRQVNLFRRLSDRELLEVATICKLWRVPSEHIIFREGDDGKTLFVIQEGCVRVSLNTRILDEERVESSIINLLYAGQSFGEMVLLDGTTRSASVVSAEPCVLLVIEQGDFSALCESHPNIGYVVMHNLASDLAYKLRSSNLLLRGNIRWQHGELGRRS